MTTWRGIGPVPEEALTKALGTQEGEEVAFFLRQVRLRMVDILSGRVAALSPATGDAETGTAPAPGPAGPPAPGPPGPPAGPEPPDLTPPPTTSGVVVSAGINVVFINTDAPVFTEGHGYDRTIVYGVKYSGTGPLPTFVNAVVVHEFVGQVSSFGADPGTQWHIWLKWRTMDGVLSVSPQGGTNGNQTTTAKIGNSNLGPLIVQAANLAQQSVDASKVAFTVGGSNLLNNASFELDSNSDGLADGWAYFTGSTGDPGRSYSLTRTTALLHGSFSQRLTISSIGNSNDSALYSLNKVARPSTQRSATFSAIVNSNTTKVVLLIRAYDAGLASFSDAVSTPIASAGVPQRLVVTFSSIPSNAAWLEVQCRGINANGEWLEIDAAKLEWGDVATAPTFLAANTIVAGDGAIANLAITNALIADLAVSDAKISNLSVTKLLAGSLGVDEYIQSSAFAPGGTGFRIDGRGGVEIANAGRSRVFHLGASGANPVLKVGSALEVRADGTATFAGALNAATGTFAGALNAATGSFAGSITAGTTITGATITGGTIQTASSGKRITLNDGGSNEAWFYGDRGDGTIELLASLGITAAGGDFAIGKFGSPNSSRHGVYSEANNVASIYAVGYGATGVGLTAVGVGAAIGMFGTSGSGFGAQATSSSGIALVASSGSNYAAYLLGNATRSHLHLAPRPGAPSLGNDGDVAMVYIAGGSVGNRTSNPRLIYWNSALGGWRYVENSDSYPG